MDALFLHDFLVGCCALHIMASKDEIIRRLCFATWIPWPWHVQISPIVTYASVFIFFYNQAISMTNVLLIRVCNMESVALNVRIYLVITYTCLQRFLLKTIPFL